MATIAIGSDEHEALRVPVNSIIHGTQGDMVWIKKSRLYATYGANRNGK